MNANNSRSLREVTSNEFIEGLHVGGRSAGNHRIALDKAKVVLEWNSRAHRKRRNPRLTMPMAPARGHWEMWGWCPGNLSWWVPFLFTVGSLVWLVNGMLVVWPPQSAAVAAWAGALTALFGGFIFILGAYAAFFEVLNRPDYVHARSTEKGIVVHPSHHPEQWLHQPVVYRWFGCEFSGWAWWLNALQLIGALVFFVACAAGVLLPAHVSFRETVWFWSPQMAGGVFFFVSSLMAMREVQDSWWKPAFNRLGWNAAFFNAVGAVGFFLCAFFGAFASGAEVLFWGSAVSTFWGSVAFLISSYLMMLEVLNP